MPPSKKREQESQFMVRDQSHEVFTSFTSNLCLSPHIIPPHSMGVNIPDLSTLVGNVLCVEDKTAKN